MLRKVGSTATNGDGRKFGWDDGMYGVDWRLAIGFLGAAVLGWAGCLGVGRLDSKGSWIATARQSEVKYLHVRVKYILKRLSG